MGEGTEFGPSEYVYDHDYKAGLMNDNYSKVDILIGKNCWIGANAVILWENRNWIQFCNCCRWYSKRNNTRK